MNTQSDPTTHTDPAVPGDGASAVASGGKTYSQAQYDGMRGAWQGKLNDANAQLQAVLGEKDALAAQLAELTSKFSAIEPQLKQLPDLQTKLTEAQTAAAKLESERTRLDVLLNYPQLASNAAARKLVMSANLEGDDLVSAIQALATGTAVTSQTTPANIAAGATPAKQGNAAPLDPQAQANLMQDEAMRMFSAGKMAEGQEKMRQVWALLDSVKKFAPPEPTLPGDRPSVG